jgi:MFS family permease
MTIPSALRLLIYVFPDPDEQARAIGIFGGSGAVASVLGLIIGGFLVQWASWPWVFWLAAIIAIPIAIVCLFFIPDVGAVEIRNDRFRSLDVPGVSILTSALILFIFGISSSTEAGWGSAMVLAPVIISIALVVAFFYWETIVPENRAAM